MNPGRLPEKEASKSFLAREKYYSDHILNNSRSMISIINRDYVYEKVNTTFCNALKNVAGSIIGKTLSDVWGPETFRKYIKNNVDKCFEGSTVRYEASFTIPRSGKRYFEVVFRPFPVDSGEITHLLAETFDITDLKISEKLALEKEEEFRKFETSLPIGFLRCTPLGVIMHTNRALRIIMECDEDELMLREKNLRDYYVDEGIFDLHLDQLSDGRPRTFGRVPLKTCRGNDIVCRITAYMNFVESSNPSYIDFSFEDSSREMMLENRLLEAQKLETIGALAGGIAHDFNNILATISGYSELLMEDLPKASASYQNVSRIKAAVSKARSLTNQILTFSRQVEQEKVIVNVYDVLKETIGFVKSGAPKNIAIKNNTRRKESPVLADPTQLFRVFFNLLTNAFQALEERKGTITINLAIVKGKKVIEELNSNIVADEYVLVTIGDTGKGMEASLLRRIFEPFFTTREVGKGSGLGLSVVHGIVTEIGGEVLVSSQKNIGSTFYVYLPVSREYPKSSKTGEGRKMILFITGNIYESRILSLALESAGYEIIQNSDRRSFHKTISEKRFKPDLILYMSDSEQIKAEDIIKLYNSAEHRPPFILIDEPDLNFPKEKLVNSGIICHHLIKPVSLKEIKNSIQLSI